MAALCDIQALYSYAMALETLLVASFYVWVGTNWCFVGVKNADDSGRAKQQNN